MRLDETRADSPQSQTDAQRRTARQKPSPGQYDKQSPCPLLAAWRLGLAVGVSYCRIAIYSSVRLRSAELATWTDCMRVCQFDSAAVEQFAA